MAFLRASVACVCLASALVGNAVAQTATFKPGNDKDLWQADTLFVGASFIRTSNKPVEIWLSNNEAAWTGELYLMDPATGRPIFLFSNKGEPRVVIDLTKLADIPLGVPLTFAYKLVPGRGGFNNGDMKWKYSGPNTRGSKWISDADNDDNNDPNARFGHRWAVAGKVKGTDRVEFGFEDMTGSYSDMDFDDVIFQARGLELAKYERRALKGSYQW